MRNRLPGRQPLPVSIGQRFGRLTVLRRGASSRSGDIRWWCECDCGKACVLVSSNGLVRKGTSSCGCLRREVTAALLRTHGQVKTPEYRCWMHLRQRCENPNDKSYPDYGGRGIAVCDRWQTFELFLEDMGPRPNAKHSIERLDVDGDYCPENCIWGDPVTQARNKTTSIWIEHEGKRLHLAEWADITGIQAATLRKRYHLGWSAEAILTTPAEAHNNRAQITFNGKSQTIADWAREIGIKSSTIHARIRYSGWSVERALTTPV